MNFSFKFGGANEVDLKNWRRLRILLLKLTAPNNLSFKLGGANEFDLKT